MNTKRYASKAVFWSQAFCALMAVMLCAFFAGIGHPWAGLACLSLVALTLNRPQARFCAVTLSVPEILQDVLDAFKLELPEAFQPGGFATDFSSKTAVLGDKITAKIAHLPVTAAYDNTPGPGHGFYGGNQDVTTLIEDVPVTLNQFRHVPIKVGWLTQLSSKIPLYKEAIRNYGYALAKYVIDTALAQATPANFSNAVKLATANWNLDTFDSTVRNQLNSQKIFDRGRWAIVGTPLAAQLGQDDRVRSSLFYGALNGDRGYRMWNNLAGFGWIREYPDFPQANNMLGIGGDARSIVIASRRPDFSNVAADLGVPQVMEFYPLVDEETGLFLTGVAWQEVGTGDVYVSAAILFGTGLGNQGGAAGTITDNAACLFQSQ